MPLENPSVTIQEDWTAAMLASGWSQGTGVNFAVTPVSFYKDPLGRVHIQGTVIGTTINTTIFTLPTGYRPPYRWQCPVGCRDGSGVEIYGKLDVFADGRVVLAAGNVSRVYLDGVNFRII